MRLHYYSQRLKQKLERTFQSKTILMEAPSGYGKTTAVRDYLDLRAGKGARVYWFTVMEEEMPGSLWNRICQVLEKVEEGRGDSLLRLGVPTNMTTADIMEEFRQIQCDQETYLVLDDFHLIDRKLSEAFYKAMFQHGGSQLHLILIAQVFSRSTTVTAKRLSVDIVRQEDLMLYPSEICDFYNLAGIDSLTEAQGELLFRKTGGWIIALCLQLKEYLDTGVLEESAGGDILQLMQQLEWDHLDEDCRKLLLLLSLFDSVTVPQVCHMLDQEWIPDGLWRFLNHDGFIRYEPQSQRYFPHVILLRLIRKKFERASEELKTVCYSRAGSWYEKQGMQADAMACFYRIRDWEGILRLSQIGMSLTRIDGHPYVDVILELLRECPDTIKYRHPVTILRFLPVLFGAGRFHEYEYELEQFGICLEKASEEEQNRLRGEWVLLSMYRKYPNLKEMQKICLEAKDLLPGGKSSVLSSEEPFGFGCVSLWFLFHSKPGNADLAGKELEQFLEVYGGITGGHGVGGSSLYRGELACMRGDYIRAEILAYKAAAEGEKYRQITICFGSALLLGRIALSRDDRPLMEYALSYLEKQKILYQNTLPRQTVVHMEETVQSMLFSMQEKHKSAADWMQSGSLETGMMAIGSLMVGHIYMTNLISNREYTKAIGMMEYMLTCDERICTNVAKHYIYIALAICYQAIQCREEAMEMLLKELHLASADGIVSNLLRFFPVIEMMVQIPEIQSIYGSFLKELQSVKQSCVVDESSVFYIAQEKEELVPERESDPILDSLSAREREVADLAAEGHSNKEIAQILCISEATVKYHLRTIFSKMQIDKRSKLVKKLKSGNRT